MNQAAFDFNLVLTEEERAVHGLLRRARALSARDLSERTGLKDKEIRQIVRNLIMERGLLAVDDPPGFFIADTADEIITATKSLRHRGIMILVRAARLQKSSLELVFNQGRLEIEQENTQCG